MYIFILNSFFLYVALKELYTHENILFIHYYLMLYVTISCKSSYGGNKDKEKKKKGLAFLLYTSSGTFLDIPNKIYHYLRGLFCLFDLILYVPSTIFQLYRDESSWVEPVLS